VENNLKKELDSLHEMVQAQNIIIRILAKHAQAHNPDFKEEVMVEFEKRHDTKKEPTSLVDFELMTLLGDI